MCNFESVSNHLGKYVHLEFCISFVYNYRNKGAIATGAPFCSACAKVTRKPAERIDRSGVADLLPKTSKPCYEKNGISLVLLSQKAYCKVEVKSSLCSRYTTPPQL